jgi:hypothetical protein
VSIVADLTQAILKELIGDDGLADVGGDGEV